MPPRKPASTSLPNTPTDELCRGTTFFFSVPWHHLIQCRGTTLYSAMAPPYTVPWHHLIQCRGTTLFFFSAVAPPYASPHPCCVHVCLGACRAHAACMLCACVARCMLRGCMARYMVHPYLQLCFHANADPERVCGHVHRPAHRQALEMCHLPILTKVLL